MRRKLAAVLVSAVALYLIGPTVETREFPVCTFNPAGPSRCEVGREVTIGTTHPRLRLLQWGSETGGLQGFGVCDDRGACR